MPRLANTPLIDALGGKQKPVFGPKFAANNKSKLADKHLVYVISPRGEPDVFKVGKTTSQGGGRFNDYSSKMAQGYDIIYLKEMPKRPEFLTGVQLANKYETQLIHNLKTIARPAKMPNAPRQNRGREWFQGNISQIAEAIAKTDEEVLKVGVERQPVRRSTRTVWTGTGSKSLNKFEEPAAPRRLITPTDPYWVVSSNKAAVKEATAKAKAKAPRKQQKKDCLCPCPCKT